MLNARSLWVLGFALGAAACSSASGTPSEVRVAASPRVTEGADAPAFSTRDQTGRPRTLAEFRGHPVVLYFYPRDATPGCTREACAFRDVWARLQQTGAVVLGVSTDSVESQARFAAEHELPFPLLADTDASMARAYGVETTVGMAHRVTFIIDAEGKVRRIYPDVDPGVHADEVLAALATLAPR